MCIRKDDTESPRSFPRSWFGHHFTANMAMTSAWSQWTTQTSAQANKNCEQSSIWTLNGLICEMTGKHQPQKKKNCSYSQNIWKAVWSTNNNASGGKCLHSWENWGLRPRSPQQCSQRMRHTWSEGLSMLMTPPAFSWKHFNRQTAKLVRSKISKFCKSQRAIKYSLCLLIIHRKGLWKRAWKFLKWLNTEVPYDPTKAFLGMYTREMKTFVHTTSRTWMSTAALFTTAKKWKQPKCPSVIEWINKMCNIHNMDIVSHKKEWSTEMCYDMDEPQKHYTKQRSQTHKSTYCGFQLYEVSRIAKS